MKTPFGKECKFFYADYFRGKHFEDCRLINKPDKTRSWDVLYCRNCPVPTILLSNACPNMILTAVIEKRFLFLRKRVKVTAYCTKNHDKVKEPKVGCGSCHENLNIEVFA
jgi:hypothetical protein